MKDIMDMKVLNLIIKQKYFDEIIAGTKTQEFREVKPTTINKLLVQDEEGYEVKDENGHSIPIEYDAIRFFVGYNKDRDSALIGVKDAYTEELMHKLCNEDGKPILYEADENGNPYYFLVNEDGDWELDENGDFIPSNYIDGRPIEAEEGDGVEVEEPITYEFGGDIWVAQQVVFNLGKILETDIKPKGKGYSTKGSQIVEKACGGKRTNVLSDLIRQIEKGKS